MIEAGTQLKGVAWDHPRGRNPLVGTLEAARKAVRGLEVAWDFRSLQRFGEDRISDLTGRYDLVVLDHPFIGDAAPNLLPLDALLGPTVLAEIVQNGVGPSQMSYRQGARQWALGIDAAAQVAAYRPDLLAKLGEAPPRTWRGVFELAGRLRRHNQWIAMPMVYTDLVPSFFTISVAHGDVPFVTQNRVVSRAVGLSVIELLRRVLRVAHPSSAASNPPAILERLAASDEIAYVPLVFGYSNYARTGFRRKLVRFTDLPTITGAPYGATLGGAGIAISRACSDPERAASYAAWLASADVQRGLYFQSGGQPAHRAAWVDPDVNAAASNFFRDTEASLDAAFVRPRYQGYQAFQDAAGTIIREAVVGGGDKVKAMEMLDAAYASSQAVRPAGTRGGRS